MIPEAVKSKFDIGDEIARGKYGVVFRCTTSDTKTPCAVKVMLKKGNKREDVLREADVLRKLDHPVVMKMHDFMECDKEYVLSMELLHGGELFDYVIEKDYLDEAEAVYYMTQILEGLDYMHKKNIVHLDLKPENIVLKDKMDKQLKIIDFGTARDLSLEKNVKVMVGTPEFIAPEALNFEPIGCPSDMWAMGVIAYVLLTGMSPFLGDDDNETMQNIAEGEFEYPDPSPEDGYEDISQLAKDFINHLLLRQPRKRGTAESSLKHDWMTKTAAGAGARNSTARLKKFKARRRWMAAWRAVSMVNLLGKIRRIGGSLSDSCPTTPPADLANCKVNGE